LFRKYLNINLCLPDGDGDGGNKVQMGMGTVLAEMGGDRDKIMGIQWE